MSRKRVMVKLTAMMRPREKSFDVRAVDRDAFTRGEEQPTVKGTGIVRPQRRASSRGCRGHVPDPTCRLYLALGWVRIACEPPQDGHRRSKPTACPPSDSSARCYFCGCHVWRLCVWGRCLSLESLPGGTFSIDVCGRPQATRLLLVELVLLVLLLAVVVIGVMVVSGMSIECRETCRSSVLLRLQTVYRTHSSVLLTHRLLVRLQKKRKNNPQNRHYPRAANRWHTNQHMVLKPGPFSRPTNRDALSGGGLQGVAALLARGLLQRQRTRRPKPPPVGPSFGQFILQNTDYSERTKSHKLRRSLLNYSSSLGQKTLRP